MQCSEVKWGEAGWSPSNERKTEDGREKFAIRDLLGVDIDSHAHGIEEAWLIASVLLYNGTLRDRYPGPSHSEWLQLLS